MGLSFGGSSVVELVETRDQRWVGKPRSIFDVAGSGQREVTTLPRV
jgi:hypothetical protein